MKDSSITTLKEMGMSVTETTGKVITVTPRVRKPRLTKRAIAALEHVLNEASQSYNSGWLEESDTHKELEFGLEWLERFLAAAESRKVEP